MSFIFCRKARQKNEPTIFIIKYKKKSKNTQPPAFGLGERFMENRTLNVINRQLRAMGCSLFEIGIRHQTSGKMMNRSWPLEQILKSVPWLQRMNAQGNDIYIRPGEDEKHGMVLIDDIEGTNVDEMIEKGHKPFLTVETSPYNIQAWVRVGKDVPGHLRGEIGRILAKAYDGDLNSADSRHYGRLAGFTNRKEKHQDKYGRQPFCLLRHANSNCSFIAPASAKLIQSAAELLNSRAKKQNTKKSVPQKKHYSFDTIAFFQSEMRSLEHKYGDEIDLSRADWMISKKLALMGCSADQIKKTLAESPSIDKRKRGHFNDYIERTVEKIMLLV